MLSEFIAGRLHWFRATALLLTVCAASAGAQTRVVRLTSKLLGEQRTLHVNLPLHYALARQRYPVVLLLDGQARPFFDLTVATAAYDLTSSVHEFPMSKQIVVGVEQGERRKDLAENDSLFYRFLVEEVLPYLDREFRTLPYRTLIGHSLGGRFALGTMCKTPLAFRAIIAISPAVTDTVAEPRTAACIRAAVADGVPRTLVLSAGSGETRIAAATTRLAALLRETAPTTWRFSRLADAGVSHTDAPLRSIPAALQFVFSADAWELPPAVADSVAQGLGDAETILARELAAISARVGVPLVVPFKWRGIRASHLLARGTIEQALAAARLLIAEYPEEMQGYMNLADAHIRARDYDNAKRALNDGLALLRKRADFDETQRAGLERVLRQALADLPQG